MIISLLRKKIIVLVLLVILFFGSIASLSVFFYTKGKLVEIQEENSKIFTKNIKNEMKLFFDNTSIEVQKISKDKEIISYAENKNKKIQDPKIVSLLQDNLVNSYYLTIYVLNTKGDAVASTDERFLNKNFSFRDYFKNSIQGNPYTDSAVGVISNELGFYFSFPIKSKTGEIVGIAVIKTSSSKIFSIIQQDLDSTNESTIMFVDQFGVILSSNKNDRVLKSLGDLTQEEIARIKESDKFFQRKIEPIQYNIVKDKLLSSSENIQLVKFFDVPDKEEEVLTFSKVNDYNFFVVLEQNYENIFNFAFRVSLIVSLFVLLAAFFAFLVISFFIYRFFKPIQ